MNSELIEELKAKVTANCPMTFTAEDAKDLLAELTSPEVVQQSALGVATIAASIDEPPIIAADAVDDAVVDDAPKEQKGSLPEDFPGRAALAGAGINTFHQARKARDSEEGLTGIAGVGDATAKAIEEALK